MIKKSSAACLSLLLLFSLSAISIAEEGKWIQLFNGKNLEGWTVKINGHKVGENFGNTFRVKDGAMQVGYEAYDDNFNFQFGHIFYKDTFSHYILRAEYRFIGEQVKGGENWALRNSGLMLHGESPETMALDQKFPVSIEVQLLGGTGKGKRTTSNLCTPGTHVEMDGKVFKKHCINSSSETYHGDQWVTVEVEVRGNEVMRHKIDGKVVLEYQKPQFDVSEEHSKALAKINGGIMIDHGTISLQSESHPVEFRKVELMKLKD
ncbi:MAG: hypothetical protein COA78_26785 [Blastopirellula sp.]|nr:MAG: hypothetical protein COA78_26785 [Blastopirellula sp.]